MWSYRYLTRIDFRVIPIILSLVCISLLIISSYSFQGNDPGEEIFWTKAARHQAQWFLIGLVVFIFCAGLDYHKLREWTWILYLLMIFSLVGLFFTHSIQSVHRWYRIPILGIGIQPSEQAKLIVVIALSWFLEKRKARASAWSTALLGGVIAAIPFFLILKQPDLGTALVILPITLVMFYFGGVHPLVIRVATICGGVALLLIALIFLEILPLEQIRPFATQFLKEYQFDRLDPHTHHQEAAKVAIAIGGFLGKGWRNSEYTAGGWLPTPYTDSVFPAFGEEFGFLGLMVLLLLLYTLVYFSFQVTAVVEDDFGRLLSAGISVYLAMHILINIGMMTGFLPITGVPLILVTYGGSSILMTMAALGILQSIYSRRFMF